MTSPWGYTVLLPKAGKFVSVLVPAVTGWDVWLCEAAQLALAKAIRDARR